MWHNLSNLRRALMPSLTEALNSRWNSIPAGTRLGTPSGISHFTVTAVDSDEIRVQTEGETTMRLQHKAFIATLEHLQNFGPDAKKPCRVGSNKSYERAGGLCKAAREANTISGTTMVITYILPILQRMGLVEINSDLPNTAWLTA